MFGKLKPQFGQNQMATWLQVLVLKSQRINVIILCFARYSLIPDLLTLQACLSVYVANRWNIFFFYEKDRIPVIALFDLSHGNYFFKKYIIIFELKTYQRQQLIYFYQIT